MSNRFIIYLSIILLGLIIGAVKFKKLTAPFKWVVIFLCCTFLSELASRVVAIKIHNSSPAYHFYVLALVSLMAIIYFLLIKKKIVRYFIVICSFLFIILSTINSLYFQKLLVFPSLSIMIADVLIVIFSLLLFVFLAESTLFKNSQMIVWWNVSVLIYFTVQLFNWGFYNYLIAKNLNSKIISNLGYITNVLFYLSVMLLVAFGKIKKNREDVAT